MKHFILTVIILLASYCVSMANQTNINKTAEAPLRVKAEKVQLVGTSDRLRWTLVLENVSPTTVLVSRFSLDSLLMAVKLSAEDGQSWQVSPPNELRDPPPPNADYTLRVAGNGKVRVEMYSNGLVPVVTAHRDQVLPYEVSYAFDRQVSIIEDGTRKAYRVRCVGSGKVAIGKSNSP